MITIEKIDQGGIRITRDTGSVCDVVSHQISAHARDPDIYDALPADVRAEVDAQRAAEAGAV